MLASSPLEEALASVSRRIWQQGLRSRALYQMGAAVVVARVRPGEVELAHAGDCRAYLLDGELRLLTEDHVEISRGRLQLVRHLGLRDLEVTRSRVPFGPGARLLLCTDGLHRELACEQLASLLSLDNACQALVEEALARGGRDNITALVIGEGRRRENASGGRTAADG